MSRSQDSSAKDAKKAQIDFEEKMFLLFALRSLYRRYVRPPMIHNWIAKLRREIKEARKGRPTRGRGRLIRFGKQVIDAQLRKPNLVSELREDYTDDADHLVNDTTRGYGLNQYGYAERRARKALSKAQNAFQTYKPTERIPTMDEVAQEREEDLMRAEVEEFLAEREDAQDAAKARADDPQWGDNRPSEEKVNAILRNACDDNGYSKDELDQKIESKSSELSPHWSPGPNPQPAGSAPAPSTPPSPQPQQTYLPGFEPVPSEGKTKVCRHSRSKWRERTCCHPDNERG